MAGDKCSGSQGHADSALRAFGRRLGWLLLIRAMVQWGTLWLFTWGVCVLGLRLAGAGHATWLLAGALGFVPVAIAAGLDARRRLSSQDIRAAYDLLNRCGGLMMAGEAADMRAWQDRLQGAAVPAIRWHARRAFTLLTIAVVFATMALWVPMEVSGLAERPMELGKVVGELQAEIETLKEEKILDPDKADDLERQLERVQEQSSAADPAKTWEALDHLKQSNSDLAQQAADEAVLKVKSLAEAETLASALAAASESGLGPEAATQAARDLAALLSAAKLEEGLLEGGLPEDISSALDSGLSRENLEKLLAAIQSNKALLGRTITNLVNIRLIDAKFLSQCQQAGLCPNPSALAEFMCSCTNGVPSFADAAIGYCRGGIDRGRADAPMTWKEETSEQGAKFKEEALPGPFPASDSAVVGVSRAAPQWNGEELLAEHGVLEGAEGAGGTALSHPILPRHKQAVRRYFEREN